MPNRPIIQHVHGSGVPPRGSLRPYEIGIGTEISYTTPEGSNEPVQTINVTLYTSTDGNNIITINGSGQSYDVADEEDF